MPGGRRRPGPKLQGDGEERKGRVSAPIKAAQDTHEPRRAARWLRGIHVELHHNDRDRREDKGTAMDNYGGGPGQISVHWSATRVPLKFTGDSHLALTTPVFSECPSVKGHQSQWASHWWGPTSRSGRS